VATGTGGSSASNTGTVQSSGELMVTKTLNAASPLLPGQVVQFTLRPALAAGADDLPAGSSITVTDQLPAQVAYFNVTAVNGGGASCNSAAAANSSRTLSCTISGPRTVAAVNAVAIVITGAPGTPGNFTNVGSVAAVAPGYFDRDPANNTANVDFSVDSGGDVQALGSFPSQAVGAGSAQTLTLSWRNNGPTALPAGGTVGTTLPAGFTVVSLPVGCSGPATGTPLAADTALSCTATAGAAASTQSFAIPLLMPTDPPRAGSFGVTVAPPATFGDSVPANNSVSLPWSVLAPFADLRGSKTKVPASGPVAPGSPITTTLRITNDSGSTHAAVYSAAGGGTELRVWDYMTPTEIAGDLLDNVSAGWACTVSPDADPTAAATRTRRVECIRTAGGLLGYGNQALDPATGVPVIQGSTLADAVNPLPAGTQLSADTVRLGLGWRVGERLTLGGEVEHEVQGDDRRRLSVGADWRLYDWARLYARWEQQSGWIHLNGVSANDSRASALVLGIDGQPLQDTQAFSEYRLRDAASGNDIQHAAGLRRQWTLAEGLGLQRGAGTHPGPARQRRHGHRGHAGAGLDRRTRCGAAAPASGMAALGRPGQHRRRRTVRHHAVGNAVDRDWTLLARHHLLHTDYRTWRRAARWAWPGATPTPTAATRWPSWNGSTKATPATPTPAR
jgi:hypothetical protein